MSRTFFLEAQGEAGAACCDGLTFGSLSLRFILIGMNGAIAGVALGPDQEQKILA